jgi:hypothetical protein
MGDAMYSGKRLDDLIEAGWHVVDTEFDAEALHYWRKKALDFLTDFVGPDHACTQSFRDCIKPTEQFDPLDRSDMLQAAGNDALKIEEDERAPVLH